MVPDLRSRPPARPPTTPRVCIDQFEFPDIPCEYPVVYAARERGGAALRSRGQAHLRRARVGGRVRRRRCTRRRSSTPSASLARTRPGSTTRRARSSGPTARRRTTRKCGTGATRARSATAGGWTLCGSNTYPAGSFPECVSSFGVYDQHGNAAEHMNLPLKPGRARRAAAGPAQTEMKGSWFIFASRRRRTRTTAAGAPRTGTRRELIDRGEPPQLPPRLPLLQRRSSRERCRLLRRGLTRRSMSRGILRRATPVRRRAVPRLGGVGRASWSAAARRSARRR